MIVVNRLDGNYAILETDGGVMNVFRDQLPKGVKEGWILKFDGEKWTVDEKAMEERRRAFQHKLRRLLKK